MRSNRSLQTSTSPTYFLDTRFPCFSRGLLAFLTLANPHYQPNVLAGGQLK